MRIAPTAVLVLALAVSPLAPRAADAGTGVSADAEKLALDGKWLLVQKRLDEAIDRLELALAIAPNYQAAREMLDQAKAKRAEAQAHYDAAETHLGQHRWDDAIREVGEAKDIFPKFADANRLLERINRAGAADACASAGQALEADRPRDAEAAFHVALRYVPDLVEARHGLATIASGRAEAAIERQLWGAALLWAQEAAGHVPDNPAYAARVEGLRSRVQERIRFGLGLVHLGPTPPSADTAALLDVVRQRVSRQAPPFVIVQVAGAPQPDFVADVEVGRFEIAGGLDRSENRIHHYVERRQEPNPEYARVRDLLDAATRQLDVLLAEYNTSCSRCGGDGWLRCPTCHGFGWISGLACPTCPASGRPGYAICPHCGGSGRWSAVSATDIYRQQRLVRQLNDQLLRTPMMILREVPTEWPYTLEHHAKTGTLEAAVTIKRTDTAAVVYTDAVRGYRRDTDTTIQNANEGVGLSPDPLELPADATVRQAVLDEAAQAAASKILAAVVGLRAAEVWQEAERLLAQGNLSEGAERGVDAAILRTAISPPDADRQMRQLRERLRLEQK